VAMIFVQRIIASRASASARERFNARYGETSA
jgi:hypothetical protein